MDSLNYFFGNFFFVNNFILNTVAAFANAQALKFERSTVNS